MLIKSVDGSQLLAKSRKLCFKKLQCRLLTSEECDLCGCTYAISFLREKQFQQPLLKAIRRGFSEWFEITMQINPYRGIHSAHLRRYVSLIVSQEIVDDDSEGGGKVQFQRSIISHSERLFRPLLFRDAFLHAITSDGGFPRFPSITHSKAKAARSQSSWHVFGTSSFPLSIDSVGGARNFAFLLHKRRPSEHRLLKPLSLFR